MSLAQQLDHFKRHDGIATFLSAKPNLSYHVVRTNPEGRVQAIEAIAASSMRINAGFFILRSEIFDFMEQGEELVERPFQRLIAANKLLAFEYDGFWMPMDTFKDKQRLDEIYAQGNAPWLVWNATRGTSPSIVAASEIYRDPYAFAGRTIERLPV